MKKEKSRFWVQAIIYTLEVFCLLALVSIGISIYWTQVRNAGPAGMEQFRAILDRSAEEGNLITGLICALFGIIILPAGYLFLTYHRVDKYFAVRKVEKEFIRKFRRKIDVAWDQTDELAEQA